MARSPFPFVSPEIVKALEEAFPNKLPSDPDILPTQFASLIGQQSVIAYLRRRLTEQEQFHRSL
jgi:hypothetical protein